MPIVVIKEGVKESSLKRRRQHDLPTPESPISSSLICGFLVSLCVLVENMRWGGKYQEIVIACPSHLGFGSRTCGEEENVSEMGFER